MSYTTSIFLQLGQLQYLTQGNFARTHEWEWIWDTYNFSLQTHKTHTWESCTNQFNGYCYLHKSLKVFNIYMHVIFKNPYMIEWDFLKPNDVLY